MESETKFLIVTIAGIIACIIGIIKLAEKDCKTKAEIMNVEYKFDTISGCFIKDGENFIDYNKYRNVYINN